MRRKEYFVDTNIFLRFLLADVRPLAKLAEKLFLAAEKNKLKLWTTDIIILEIVWTLKSFYQYSNKNIQKTVSGLLGLKNLRVRNRKLLIQALKDFEDKKVDFADAYNYQLALKFNKKIVSFDKDFDKLGKRWKIQEIISSKT